MCAEYNRLRISGSFSALIKSVDVFFFPFLLFLYPKKKHTALAFLYIYKKMKKLLFNFVIVLSLNIHMW